MFPGGDDNVKTKKQCTLLPEEYFAAFGGPSLEQELDLYSKTNCTERDSQGKEDGLVRPCKILAGARLPAKEDLTNATARSQQTSVDNLARRRLHDFRRADQAASLRIPVGCQDADQARLVEALALTAGADAERIRHAMICLLEQKPLPY